MKEILRTRRLLLREMTEGDIPDLEEILLDPEVTYAYPHTFTKEDVENWLARQQQRYRQDGFGLWAVVLRSTGEVVGQAGLSRALRGPAGAGGGLPAEKALLAPGLCQRGRQGLPGLRLPDAGGRRRSAPSSRRTIWPPSEWPSATAWSGRRSLPPTITTCLYLTISTQLGRMTVERCVMEQLKALCAIDSPSGFTDRAADYLIKELSRLGWAPERTRKGGVRVCLGGEGRGLLLMAHVDTLGAVVQTIKANGRLVLSPVGGLRAENCEAENCRIYTRFDGVYTGCLQICNASVHVNDDYAGSKRAFDKMEVVIDQPVRSEQDTRALGICEGGFRLLRSPHRRHRVRLHQEPLLRRQAQRRHAAGLCQGAEGPGRFSSAEGVPAFHRV